MIDLKKFSGFTLLLDSTKNRLIFNLLGSSSYESDVVVSLSDLFPILLNKNIQYPQKVYRKYTNVAADYFNPRQTKFDLYLIPYGLLGIEFIKSHIYYTPDNNKSISALVQCYHGNLVILMQKHNYSIKTDHLDYFVPTSLEDVKFVECKPGESITIPSGYYYTFINTGTEPVVFSKLSYKDSIQVDYKNFKKEKGMALFIISKNAKVEKVSNPKYKFNRYGDDFKNMYDSETTKDLFVKTETNLFIENLEKLLNLFNE